ncbi:MAG TPA: Rrf2 family transcriptional regulator [Gemmatimonadaceae bacterium]|nr:Rrf2 family transcriptional regulator [Gemmatimonadaceae bacterium]
MNSRFAVAVHILTVIAHEGGEPVTSEYIAWSVNTNPSLIRRMLSQLTRAGLTRCQMGAGGGALLAKPAARITLRDVYRAVADGDVFALPRERPDPACPVGRNIQALLTQRFEEATRALEDELARTTIADMQHALTDRGGKRGRRRMAG